ncbi:putative LIM domain transcription factor LMO4-like protein [Naja naja]|nr:putative LIM domain transcription factor LMO4-like protein [Naja naja]
MVNPGSSSQPPPVTSGSLSWKRCAGCGGKIADRFLLYAMDSYWHSRCLKCSCCQAQLGEIGTSCYTKSGMILCRNDYIRLFGNSGACSACGQSIPASELVMRAQGNVYHLKCFTCSTCRNRLVPGDRFHYINGSLFCEHDRPTALINGHLNSLQSNPLLPDQKCFLDYSTQVVYENIAVAFEIQLTCVWFTSLLKDQSTAECVPSSQTLFITDGSHVSSRQVTFVASISASSMPLHLLYS